MPEAIKEITFVGMPRKHDESVKPAPSAVNMPGWRSISEGLKDAIESSGMPVTVIAERTQLTRQYIYSMMNGTCNPTMDKVESVFKAIDLSFKDWIEDRSLYGRDKKLHDQLQFLLNQKGITAVTIRTTLEALMSLQSGESHQ